MLLFLFRIIEYFLNDESLGFFEGRVVRLVDIGLCGAGLGMSERFRDGGQGDIFLIGMARPSVPRGVGREGIGIVDHYRQLFQQAVLPVDIIPWEMLDNSSKISQFKIPVLFLHGRRDMIVPFRNARENLRSAPDGLGKLVEFPECGHYGLSENQEYWREIVEFIKSGGHSKRR